MWEMVAGLMLWFTPSCHWILGLSFIIYIGWRAIVETVKLFWGSYKEDRLHVKRHIEAREQRAAWNAYLDRKFPQC